MAQIRGIRRAEELRLNAGDFQFSIKRLLVAITVCALILATARPAGVDLRGTMVVVFAVLVILLNDWSMFYLGHAHQMLRLGNLEKALVYYGKAIRAAPGRPDRYCYRAAAYFEQGNLDAAAQDYTEAIRAESRFVPAWIGRANMRYRAGRFQEAVDDTTIALCLAPGDRDALYVRGSCHACLGDFDAALADLDELLRVKPEHPEAHYVRGRTHLWAKQYSAAIEDWSIYQQRRPQKKDVAIGLARARFGLGDYQAAIDLLEQYLSAYPESPEALGALAWMLATCPDDRLRDGQRSLELAERAVAKAPQDGGTVLSSLAAAYAELGRFEEAIEHGRQALAHALPCHRADREVRLATYEAFRPFRESPGWRVQSRE